MEIRVANTKTCKKHAAHAHCTRTVVERTDDRLMQLLALNHHTDLRTMLDVDPDWTLQPV